MKKPLISIIVPIYNASPFLRRCIECILRQTFEDYELLLIDDGSSDNSGQICEEYARKDARVRVFHKENGGVSSARNLGLEHVKGDYVTFADADDWMEESWLHDFAVHAGKADIIFQNAVWHYDDGRTFLRSIRVDETLTYKQQLASLYPRSFLGYIWATLFRTDIVKRHGIRFNTQFKFKEDRDFVLSYCMYASSLIVLPSRNYHYIFPSADSRSYNKPNLSRVLLEIEERRKIRKLFGEEADVLYSDVSVTFELMRLYASDTDKDTKLKALSCVYAIGPMDSKGKGRLACVTFMINHLPLRLTHRLLLLIARLW